MLAMGGWEGCDGQRGRIFVDTTKTSGRGQEEATHCFRVFEKRVGILSAVCSRQDRSESWALKGGRVVDTSGSDVEIHACARRSVRYALRLSRDRVKP
jgi:hypothetical protein